MGNRKRRLIVGITIYLFFLPLFQASGDCSRSKQANTEDPEFLQCLHIELKRLEETYSLLDTFAQKVWPGWDNYHEVEFKVQFPNLVFLLYNPLEEVPEGYEEFQDKTILGKKVYLNQEERTPFRPHPPLTGGGGGGKDIRIKLRQREVEPGKERIFNSEGQILLYVHEFFHGYQEDAWKWDEETRKGFTYNIDISPEFATFAEIEQKALLKAYLEEDKEKAIEHLKEFYAARMKKQEHMTPEEIMSENHSGVAEGTATYANTKMAMLINEADYTPKISRSDDPYFFEYKYLDENLKQYTVDSMEGLIDKTFDTLGPSYTIGAMLCLLLDRYVMDWKKGFLENDRNQFQILQEFLKLNDEEISAISERNKILYGFDEIFARHEAAINEREEAIQVVKGRKGTRYIIDSRQTREYLRVTPRGKEFSLDFERLFPHGIEQLILGDVKLVSQDTPMSRPNPYTVIWVDTEPKEGKRGYKVTFENQEGNTYRNAVITTSGFTLEVPKVKILEKKGEVRFIILSKVVSCPIPSFVAEGIYRVGVGCLEDLNADGCQGNQNSKDSSQKK
jgi:hypothetical protein